MRIALVTDSHLADRAPECLANWRAAEQAVRERAPDLTLHLGDVSLDGATCPHELDEAARVLTSWPAPLLVLPGNHDMGTASGEEPFDRVAHARCLAALGPDRFRLERDGWTLVGLDAQLLGSGTPEEAEQWDWLEREAERLAPRARVALFLHRPLRRAPGHVGLESDCYVPAAAAARLLGGPLARRLELVASGHTHRGHDFVGGGMRHLWVPSTAFVVDDGWMQPGIGLDAVGLGLLTLEADASPRYERLAPAGMACHAMTRLPCLAGGA